MFWIIVVNVEVIVVCVVNRIFVGGMFLFFFELFLIMGEIGCLIV